MSNPFAIQSEGPKLSLDEAAKSFPGSIMARKAEEITFKLNVSVLSVAAITIILTLGLCIACTVPKYFLEISMSSCGLTLAVALNSGVFMGLAFAEDRKRPSRTYQEWDKLDSSLFDQASNVIELYPKNEAVNV